MHESQLERQQWRRRLIALKEFPEILRLLWHSSPRLCVSVGVIRVLSAMAPVAMLAVSRSVIDEITSGVPGQMSARLWLLVAVECALALGMAVLGRTIGWIESLLADHFSYELSIRVMRHAATLDLAAYENPSLQDLLERARVQATDRIRVVRGIGDGIQQTALAVGFSSTLFLHSSWLTLLLVCCVLPAVLGDSHYAFRGYTLGLSQTARRREVDYLRVLVTSPDSAKEIRLFDLGGYFAARFGAVWRSIYRENAQLARARWLGGIALSLLLVAGYYACYIWVIWRLTQGELSLGTMIQLSGAIAGTSGSLQGASATIAGLADEALFLTDLTAFLRYTPGATVILPPTGRRTTPDGFCFEHVSFRYPGATSDVIDNLTLHLPIGQRVALVGRNGQGKSTLVKLMTRLYDPTAGRILLNGIDLREYRPEELARTIAVLFQDFMKYDLTARENIALGHVDEIDDTRPSAHVLRAAEMSLAMPVIEDFPRRFEQMLGRRFDDSGRDLSGGQWQKLALARAYVRNTRVLILDEPTAALDPQSEREIFERLETLSRGRLTLLISHRFSTVRLADRILVLEEGTIMEDGSHDRLLDDGGRYAELFTLQAASYR